jgi:hypothetical protein
MSITQKINSVPIKAHEVCKGQNKPIISSGVIFHGYESLAFPNNKDVIKDVINVFAIFRGIWPK